MIDDELQQPPLHHPRFDYPYNEAEMLDALTLDGGIPPNGPGTIGAAHTQTRNRHMRAANKALDADTPPDALANQLSETELGREPWHSRGIFRDIHDALVIDGVVEVGSSKQSYARQVQAAQSSTSGDPESGLEDDVVAGTLRGHMNDAHAAYYRSEMHTEPGTPLDALRHSATQMVDALVLDGVSSNEAIPDQSVYAEHLDPVGTFPQHIHAADLAQRQGLPRESHRAQEVDPDRTAQVDEFSRTARNYVGTLDIITEDPEQDS